jgi:branched-chain amino acid transport system ATP-binding protein
MTALEHVELAICLRHEDGFFSPLVRTGKQHAEEALHWLETGGLTGSRGVLAVELSQGHRKALELVMALARGCTFLSIDEPTAGMGHAERMVVMDLVRGIVSDQGVTCLIVEHDMHVVSELAEDVTLLVGGRIAFEGTVVEMRSAESMSSLYFGTSFRGAERS